MEPSSLFGLNLPLYLIVTFVLAYFIWSKFLNNNGLKFQNIDDLFDLMAIFTVLLVSLLSLVTALMIVVQLLSFQVNIDRIFKEVPDAVLLFVLLLIWSLIIDYRHRESTEEDLQKFLSNLVLIFFFFFTSLLALNFLIYSTSLRFAFPDLYLILLLITIPIIFCVYTIKKVLCPIDIKKSLFNKNNVIIFITVLVVIFFLGALTIPLINYKNVEYERYEFSELNPNRGSVYLRAKVPIDINSFGLITSLVPSIPVSYKKYNFDTMGYAGEHFVLSVNTSKGGVHELTDSFERLGEFSKHYQNFGFTKALVDNERKLINLIFDRDEVKDEEVNQIILEGLIPKNLSNLDYHYSDNKWSDSICNSTYCTAELNITNKFQLPVYHQEGKIIHFKHQPIKNASKCHFKNVSYSKKQNDNVVMRVLRCKGEKCTLNGHNRKTDERVVHIHLQINHKENYVIVGNLELDVPIELHTQFQIACK